MKDREGRDMNIFNSTLDDFYQVWSTRTRVVYWVLLAAILILTAYFWIAG